MHICPYILSQWKFTRPWGAFLLREEQGSWKYEHEKSPEKEVNEIEVNIIQDVKFKRMVIKMSFLLGEE